jgi:hypothetical protein
VRIVARTSSDSASLALASARKRSPSAEWPSVNDRGDALEIVDDSLDMPEPWCSPQPTSRVAALHVKLRRRDANRKRMTRWDRASHSRASLTLQSGAAYNARPVATLITCVTAVVSNYASGVHIIQ